MSIYEPLASSDAHRHLQLRSPVTLEPTGELVCANAEDVAAAIARARAAQPAWAATSMKERAAIVQRALKIVLETQDEIIDTVVAETGKARTDAQEVLKAVLEMASHLDVHLGAAPGPLNWKTPTARFRPFIWSFKDWAAVPASTTSAAFCWVT